ncbi:MAG: sigma 54-interacting transcriptional regulator, partial [Ferruginibacter sp.]
SNEEIIRQEEEKTLLLAFSSAVAGLSTRNDFFPVVNSQLKKIFSLERFGIANIHEDRKTHNAFMMDLGDPATNDDEFEFIMTTKYDVNDPVFGGIMNSDEPVLLDVDELALDASLPIYVRFWKKVGFKYLFCVQLRVGGNDIGIIFFDFDDPNTVQTLKTNLLKGVCAQIALAVSNILANEDITRREKERALLLTLNMDMVAVRTTEELMELINQRLKTLLNFSHTNLCKINDDKTTVTPYLYDPNSRSKSHPRYQELKGGRFPIDDGIMNKSIATSFPVLTELEDLKKLQKMPLYVIINYDSGIRQIVTVRFTRGHEHLGFWMIFFDKKIHLDPAKSGLIKGIADGMSIAVSNIIANEEIYVRENEKTRLLEFSNAMASVKDKKQLGRILKQHLKELFSINFYVIHAISQDKKTFRPIFYDPDAEFAKHPDFIRRANISQEIKGSLINKILKSENSLSFTLEEFLGNLTSKPYLALLRSRQANRITSVRLKLGEENIGVFNFNQCENNPKSIQQNLFKSICSQIAINLSNIITNDEIINREQEKSLLLEFSNNIAAIRDRFLLAKVLTDQLNKLFGIQDYAIHALSEDKKTHRPILYDPDAKFAKTAVFQQMIAQPSDVNDGVFNNVLSAKDTLTLNINEWVNASKPPTYTEAALSLGIVKLTGIAIRLGDESIAVMNFRHDDSNRFEIHKQLFKSICSQLAIVISNLITHDEIIRKEQEKSVLLAFSNNIAAIRDKFLLAKVLTDQLNKLFGIQDYAIHALSEDKKTHRPILYDPDAAFAKTPIFRQMIAQPSDVDDGVFNSILNATDTVTFSIKDWVHSPKPPIYADAAVSLGIIELTGVAILLGDEAIAVMNFNHDESNRFKTKKQLFQSICSQLAIAVSNLIANEKIENQLHEINTYKQQLEEEKIYLKEEIATTLNYDEIIGESPEIQKTFHLIKQVAPSDSTVLLQGETGTGKE